MTVDVIFKNLDPEFAFGFLTGMKLSPNNPPGLSEQIEENLICIEPELRKVWGIDYEKNKTNILFQLANLFNVNGFEEVKPN